MRIAFVIPLVALAAACSAISVDVRGRVVDAENNPLPGARIVLWSFPTADPASRPSLEADGDGAFDGTLPLPPMTGMYVMAYDKNGTVGGFAPLKDGEDVTIVAQPLTVVKGRVTYEKLPKPIREYPPGTWNHVYLQRSGEKYRMFAGGPLTGGEFSFRLPPGDYSVQVFGLHVPILKTVHVEGGGEIDLGTLVAVAHKGNEIIGSPAPELSFVDARGIALEGGLAALKGKWVVLIFWDHRMRQNAHWLKSLMKFYSERPELRDRMKFVGVHNGDDVLTVAELERARLWDNGHHPTAAIPFPVGIDKDEKTFNAYGLVRGPARSSPVVLLLDPEGVVTFHPDSHDIIRLVKSKLGVE
jgi:hypothetical protein